MEDIQKQRRTTESSSKDLNKVGARKKHYLYHLVPGDHHETFDYCTTT